jgi:hypothetical protein
MWNPNKGGGVMICNCFGSDWIDIELERKSDDLLDKNDEIEED